MLIVSLVKEHVLAVAAFSGPLFQDTLLADPVFSAQTLPVHRAHFRPRPVVRFDDRISEGSLCPHFGCRIVLIALSRSREACLFRIGQVLKRVILSCQGGVAQQECAVRLQA